MRQNSAVLVIETVSEKTLQKLERALLPNARQALAELRPAVASAVRLAQNNGGTSWPR